MSAPVAVVIAGGRGQRLRPLTDKVPKPLLRLGASTIIERIVQSLKASGVEDLYLSVNYKAQDFEDRLGDGSHLGVRISYLKERRKLDTAGPLSLLPARPDAPVLVTNGDILTRLDFRRLFRYHASHDSAATICAVAHATRIPYGVLQTSDDVLTGFEEKPEVKVLVNAGIYMLDPDVLDLVEPETAISMPDLLGRVMAEGQEVRVFQITDKWFDIGTPEDFQEVLIEFATGEEE
jgi:NDP-sugar pyrophosphorylase family protein